MIRCIVYLPPRAGFPYLAVVLRNKELIAVEPVESVEEGNELLGEVKQRMPEFLDQAERARRIRH